jgi:hypothetical protein
MLKVKIEESIKSSKKKRKNQAQKKVSLDMRMIAAMSHLKKK